MPQASSVEPEYDLFVSYARADNRDGWIERFVETLAGEYRALTGRELTYFFDRNDIRHFSHWEGEIFHKGLTRCQLFLTFLSPSYFASEVCRKEWVRWVEQEIARHVLADGAAPVYIVEVPALFGKPMPPEHEVARQVAALCNVAASERFVSELSPVVREFRRRQLNAVMPFYREGLEALQRDDLRRELRRLAADVERGVTRVIEAAKSVSTVPPYNRKFTGRLDELVRLRDLLRDNQAGVIAGVHGLGGIGKTELAFTYAHAYAGVYPGGRFYLPCEYETDLRRVLMRLDEAAAFRSRITDEERKGPDTLFPAVVRVLKERLELGRVLLVLDNVSDVGLLSEQQTDGVTMLGGGLHLLATTRLGTAGGRRCLTLGEMAFEDALGLLEKYRPFADDAERAAAETIVRRLGGFALAIELVAARLAVRTTATYAGVARDLGLEKLDTYAEDQNVELRRHNHEKRLERVLGPTLAELPVEALRALEYAALLPPDRVALPWLRALVVADFPSLGEPGPDGEDRWGELVESLVRLALFTRIEEETPSRRQVKVHRLVQDLIRRGMTEEEVGGGQGRIDQLIRGRNEELKATTRWQEARWELEPLEALAKQWDEAGHPLRDWLLGETAFYLHRVAEWGRAEPLCRRALAISRASRGPHHPEVATSMNNLAEMLWATNRAAEAEPLLRQALAIHEASLGPDHPTVGNTLHNVAGLLLATNRVAEAEPLFRRALAIHEASRGPDHPTVGTSLNGLAQLLNQTNRAAEAEPLLRRALAISEASLGPDHPTVALKLNNLADNLTETNRAAEAEPLYRRALAVCETSLGPAHPEVATILNNLAEMLRATNRAAEAEPLYRRALAVCETSLGPAHPEVATILHNLAEMLRVTNRAAEAEPLYRRALAVCEASLGPDHPKAAIITGSLAVLLEDTNRAAEAEPLLRWALAVCEASLGPAHPEVATILNNLAEMLRATNRAAEAEPLYRRALAVREASLGPDHPIVAASLNNLAQLLRATNRPTEAEPLYERGLHALFRFQQITGHEHPYFRTCVNNFRTFLKTARGLTEDQATAWIREMLGSGSERKPSMLGRFLEWLGLRTS